MSELHSSSVSFVALANLCILTRTGLSVNVDGLTGPAVEVFFFFNLLPRVEIALEAENGTAGGR
jgi:hypothetical protein